MAHARPTMVTVIVTVDASLEVMDDLVDHARAGVEQLFGECEEFVGGALRLSDDGTRLLQYTRWDSEASYERCRDDQRWGDLPSAIRFMGHVAAGTAVIDARLYTVLADSGLQH